MKAKTKRCSICGNDLDDRFGHNAQPINDGRCCDTCNATVVIPRRLRDIGFTESACDIAGRQRNEQ